MSDDLSQLLKKLIPEIGGKKTVEQEELLKEGISDRQIFDAYNHFNSCLGIFCWQLILLNKTKEERKILSESLIAAWKYQVSRQLDLECDKFKIMIESVPEKDQKDVIAAYRKERGAIFQEVEVTIRNVLNIAAE